MAFKNSTFTATAPSGFEYETKRMMAYHQEWLTQGNRQNSSMRGAKKNKSEKRAEDIMCDILVHIDGDYELTPDKIKKLPSWDFKHMLFVARYFSCDLYFAERMEEYDKFSELLKLWNLRKDYEENKITAEQLLSDHKINVEDLLENEALDFDNAPEYTSQLPDHIFKFTYEWEDKVSKEVREHQYELPLHMHDFKITKPWRSFTWKELLDATATNGLGNKDVKLKLPISEQELVWHILDLEIEERMRGGFQPDEVNVNTALKWRNPRIMSPKQANPGEFMPIVSNSSKFELLDNEAFRQDVFSKEGKVDSMLTLKLPETGQLIKVDVLNTVTFFIPSGVL